MAAKTIYDNLSYLPNPLLTQIMSALVKAVAAERRIMAQGQTSWAAGYSRKNIREWEASLEACRNVVLKRNKTYVDGQEVLDV